MLVNIHVVVLACMLLFLNLSRYIDLLLTGYAGFTCICRALKERAPILRSGAWSALLLKIQERKSERAHWSALLRSNVNNPNNREYS